MKINDIIKALQCCMRLGEFSCVDCPYFLDDGCDSGNKVIRDLYEYLRKRYEETKKGE